MRMRASPSTRYVECPVCERFICVNCKVSWHSSMSCEEFQNLPEEERDASDITLHRLAQNKRWKRCQRRMIELTHGCYHMTCLHNNQLTSLSPCLDYIRGNASTPPSCCCSQLAFLVKSQPQCLCEAVNGDASSIAASLNINQTRAFTLPSACNVHTPPISTCSGSTIFFSNWCFCFQLSKFPFRYQIKRNS